MILNKQGFSKNKAMLMLESLKDAPNLRLLLISKGRQAPASIYFYSYILYVSMSAAELSLMIFSDCLLF